ncbi:MAG: hypothetical protein KatS3mg009_3350 [Acidimicrobiia bacterium]|nr:MAG: hypothetical protein KatS3mg009_3350 [Acidimicrobiia bacterium]
MPRPRAGSRAGAAAVPAAAGVALALALVLVARVLLADPGPVPLVHADEAGYLGNARQLVDGAGGTGNGYFAGYSLLLAPAAAVTGDPSRFYALALVTNAFLLAASGVLAALVVRRLFPGATHLQVIAAVVVVFAQPASFTAAGLAMSENAMFAVTLAATWLLASVADADDRRRLAAAGVAAGFAYWVSPRGVVVAAAFAVALVAAARGWLGRAALAPALGALVASVAAGHAFNAVVANGSGTAGLSARRTGLLDALTEPSLWPELGARLAGRVSYVGVTTLGLAVVGCAVGLGRLADARRGGGDGRRAAGGFAALAVVLTLVADAVTLDAGAVPRPIHYVYYGRYTEAVALPAVVIGTGWLLDRARDGRRLLGAGLLLTAGLVVSTALAHVLVPPRAHEPDGRRLQRDRAVPAAPAARGDVGHDRAARRGRGRRGGVRRRLGAPLGGCADRARAARRRVLRGAPPLLRGRMGAAVG